MSKNIGGVLGRSIHSLEYEGNKASDERLDSYFNKENRDKTNDDD